MKKLYMIPTLFAVATALTPAAMATETQTASAPAIPAAPAAPADQAEEKIKVTLGSAGELRISGYLQAQWQIAQSKGIPAVAQGGSFGSNIDNRFMVRRGRIKFTYSYQGLQLVIQPDFTEKGAGMKDAYLSLSSKNKVITGQAGLFDRPFGYEISYSSSRRESPERSVLFNSLFPGERDLGAMAVLRGPKGSWTNDFTINAGIFNGNGIGSETDSRKDFIGRIAWLRKFNNTELGFAFSAYYGGIFNPTEENYHFVKGEGFQETEGVQGKYSKRQYLGVGAQFKHTWAAGTTHIRGEYLWGHQPGTAAKNANPGGSSLGAGSDPLYLRNFRGGYVYFIQDIGRSKHSVVFKYDNYDPNIRVKGHQIGELAGTGAADIAYNTYGVGYLFRMNSNFRVMAYYDIVCNEKSKNMTSETAVKDFSKNIKDNVFTLRFQVSF